MVATVIESIDIVEELQVDTFNMIFGCHFKNKIFSPHLAHEKINLESI